MSNINQEGEQKMNDKVKTESVEITAPQEKAGETKVSETQSENKIFTEEQVENIVQRRLERFKKSVSNKLDGIDIEEAKKLIEEKKQKEIELAKQRGEFDKVLKETVSKKDSKIMQLESELSKIRIDETLVNVASGMKAVKPAEVKQLLRNNVRLNEQGSVEVINALGKRRIDFTSQELARYGDYCVNDTELTYTLFNKLLDGFPQQELKLIDLTIRMFAEPVLEVDTEMLVEHLTSIRNFKDKLLDASGLDTDTLMSNNVSDVLNAAAQTLIKLRSFTERRRF